MDCPAEKCGYNEAPIANYCYDCGFSDGTLAGIQTVVDWIEQRGFITDMNADILLDEDYFRLFIRLEEWEAQLKVWGIDKRKVNDG